MKPLTRLCKRHKTTLWGQPHFVTPRLADWIHGDGLKVIYLTPIMTRPNYYVVRIDSKINLDNFGKPPVFVDEVLPELHESIEDQYGRAHEEWEHDNGRTYHRHNPFPAMDDEGCAWGNLTTLTEPDTRPEHKIRSDIKRTK